MVLFLDMQSPLGNVESGARHTLVYLTCGGVLKAKLTVSYVYVHAYVVPVYWCTARRRCIKLGTVIAIFLNLVERLLVFVEVAVLDHYCHGSLHIVRSDSNLRVSCPTVNSPYLHLH